VEKIVEKIKFVDWEVEPGAKKPDTVIMPRST
jgi:hypothetical protein